MPFAHHPSLTTPPPTMTHVPAQSSPPTLSCFSRPTALRNLMRVTPVGYLKHGRQPRKLSSGLSFCSALCVSHKQQITAHTATQQATLSNIPQHATLSNIPQHVMLSNIPQHATLSNIPQHVTLSNIPQHTLHVRLAFYAINRSIL